MRASLIVYARDQLNARLSDDLRARAEERVYLETPEGPGGYRRPDVRVIE